MNYVFLDEAESEFYDAVAYYEDRRDGLGLELAREVFLTIDRMIAFPDAWSSYSNRTRRCLVKRFPYGIVYRHIENTIVIFAVMQLNREPDYWEKRLA
jgi:plasmid stabilization system protein ParE